MASYDKAAMAMATDDGADMQMATKDEVVSPTVPEMGENHMSIEEESQSPSPSVSHGQIDGNKDAVRRRYVDNPPNTTYAKVQGMAKLREVLNDPDGKIANNIRKILQFGKQLSSNNHCKKVRKFLIGDKETPMTDETVPFILSIWCVLGGKIPSMWLERVPGGKKGSKLPLTDWGKRMIEELDHLGATDGYEFDICQAYAVVAENKTRFNWDKAAKDLMSSKDEAEQAAKKLKRNAKPASLGKHGASYPGQSPASKRRKNVAIEKPQSSRGSFADDDDTEDEGNRGEVGNEVMYGGSKQGVPASEASTTKVDSNRGIFQCPEGPRNCYRDQDSVPPQLEKTRPLLGTYRNQDTEGSMDNEAFRRRYGPGLKTSNMSSDKAFMGRESHDRKKAFSFEKPTAPGVTTGMLSTSYRNATASSGQHIFGMPFALQQDSTASPSQTPFEVSASVPGGSDLPHVHLHSATEHPSGLGNANMMNDSHFGDAEDDLLSLSQQISMPGHQNTLQVTNPVNHRGNTRDEDFATANREDSDRLDEAVSNRNMSGASFPGAQTEDPGQDDPDCTVLSTQFPAFIGHFEASTQSAKLWYKDWMEQNEQNEKELSLLRRNDTAKDTKIAALEEEVNIWRAAGNEMEQLKRRITELEEVSKKSRRTADLLNRTSALTLLHRAGSMGKGLDTISSAELLDKMDGDDGTGASEVEGS